MSDLTGQLQQVKFSQYSELTYYNTHIGNTSDLTGQPLLLTGLE